MTDNDTKNPLEHLIDDHGTAMTQKEIDALSDQIAYCISVAQENHDLRIAVQAMPSATKEMRENRTLPEIDISDCYYDTFSRATRILLSTPCDEGSKDEVMEDLGNRVEGLCGIIRRYTGEEFDIIREYFKHNSDEGE